MRRPRLLARGRQWGRRLVRACGPQGIAWLSWVGGGIERERESFQNSLQRDLTHKLSCESKMLMRVLAKMPTKTKLHVSVSNGSLRPHKDSQENFDSAHENVHGRGLVVAQRARRGISMPRGRNCRETNFCLSVALTTGVILKKKRSPLLQGRGKGGI